MRQTGMRNPLRWIAPLIVALVACISEPPKGFKPRDQMSQREKDSVLGESVLPGAPVVRRALSASDAEAGHTALLDSASQ